MHPIAGTALTIGGAMHDTIVVLENNTVERISLSNAHLSYLLLEEGQKAEADLMAQSAGGGAVNTAIALARLGFKTSTLIKVGTDDKAAQIRTALAREGVSLQYVRETDRLGTGSSVLILAHDRNAAIFTYRGANGLLDFRDIAAAGLANDLVYISGLSNESATNFPAIVRAAHSAGAYIAANPGARQLSARADEFWSEIAKLSVLCVNRHEASLLIPHMKAPSEDYRPIETTSDTAPPWLLKYGLQFQSIHRGLIEWMRRILAMGVRTVVVTDGARGAYAATGAELTFCPALAAKVQGTTGAGDAFSSTFAAYAATGHEVGVCLQRATTNASAVVTVADAHSALLTHTTLEQVALDRSFELKLSRWPI